MTATVNNLSSHSDVPSNQLILVTGAGGFIGKSLCVALHHKKYSVLRALRDCDPTGEPALTDFAKMGLIDESTDWTSALEKVDCVVHLLARVHLLNDGARDPLAEFRRVNVDLTMNLARQASEAGVRRFVFVSSIKVNGENTSVGQPFTAEDIPCPMDFYGISKLEAEQFLKQLAETTGMEVVIVRPVLVYGPEAKANFAALIRWLKLGVPLPLGAIHNQRSLVSLDNLVDLLIVCINHPAARNQTFLVSDGEDVSVTNLLVCLGQAMGSRVLLIDLPASWLRWAAFFVGKRAIARRLLDNLQVDISKTRRLLGWSPPLTLEQGLEKAVAKYLRKSKSD